MSEAATFTLADLGRIELDARRVEDIVTNLESSALTGLPGVAVGHAECRHFARRTASAQFILSAEPQEIRKLVNLFLQTEESAASPFRAAPAAIPGANAPRYPVERR